MKDPLQEVARRLKVSINRLRSGDQDTECLRARYAAAWVYRNRWETMPMSHQEIALAMGGYERTTILAAVRRANEFRERDPVFRRLTDTVLAECREP